MLFSKVSPLSLHGPLVQGGTRAEGLGPPGVFLGCQSPRAGRVGTGDLAAGEPHAWAAPEGLLQEMGPRCGLPCPRKPRTGCIYTESASAPVCPGGSGLPLRWPCSR